MNLADVNCLDAQPGSQCCGNPKEGFFGWALVGFVDLLGFTERIYSSWSKRDDSPLACLLRIKKAAASIPQYGLVSYTPGQNPPAYRVNYARVQTISDSIVICNALPQKRNLNDLSSAMCSVSSGIQHTWIAAIQEGFTIRGSIELGQVYWSEAETIGPAFISAYKLEQCASTSRIIAGPTFLQNLMPCMPDNWSEDPSSNWLSVSNDGLIQFTPNQLLAGKANAQNLRSLRDKSGQNAYKYDELLACLDGLQVFKKATRGDMNAAYISLRRSCPLPRLSDQTPSLRS